MEGLEKYNGVITKMYFRSSLRTQLGPGEEAVKQITEKGNRLEYLRDE